MHNEVVTANLDLEAILQELDRRLQERISSGEPADPGLFLERGKLLETCARYHEALVAFQDYGRALQDLGIDGSSDAAKHVANILFKLNRYADALPEIARSARLRGDLGLEEDWELSKLRGNCYYKLGRNDDALAAYHRAESIQQAQGLPVYPFLAMNRGAVYIQLGDYDRALQAFDETEQLLKEQGLPLDPDLAMNSGVLLGGLGRWDEALQAYTEAEQLFADAGLPEDVNLLSNRGIALTQLGKIEEALEQFDRSERLRRERGQAESTNLMFHRAIAHYKAGRKSQAIHEAHNTIELASRQNLPIDRFLVETLRDWLTPVQEALLLEEQSAQPAALEPVAESQKRYDAFICYRRTPGLGHAMLLKTHLDLHKKTVFRDQDDLPRGTFRPQLEQAVRAARHLIVLLTPDFFAKCLANDEDDVRREIRTALNHGVEIIPVMMDGFQWPRAEELPEDIRAVCSINGMSFSSEFFPAFMDKLLRWME